MKLPFKISYGYRRNTATKDQPPNLEYRQANHIIHAVTYEEARQMVWEKWKVHTASIQCLWSPDEIEIVKKRRKKLHKNT